MIFCGPLFLSFHIFTTPCRAARRKVARKNEGRLRGNIGNFRGTMMRRAGVRDRASVNLVST